MSGRMKRKIALAAAAAAVFLTAAGCGGGKEEIYPLSVDGTEITLDQTTMQTIYDASMASFALFL